eukprot:7745602-Alexandrium_andersonii.AAC.1
MHHAPAPTPVLEHAPAHEATRVLAGPEWLPGESTALVLEDANAAHGAHAGARAPWTAQRIQIGHV